MELWKERSFFPAAVVSILMYGCTTWTLTKRMEKKLDGNYTRMLRAILNKSKRQQPTKQQLYGHLSPITKTIQVRRTRHVRHCWRSNGEFISDILQWIYSRGRAKVGRPVRTYIPQLCANTGCSLEDLPGAMDDREGWRERVREICGCSVTWWWWFNCNFHPKKIDLPIPLSSMDFLALLGLEKKVRHVAIEKIHFPSLMFQPPFRLVSNQQDVRWCFLIRWINCWIIANRHWWMGAILLSSKF